MLVLDMKKPNVYLQAFRNRLVDGGWKQLTATFISKIIQKKRLEELNRDEMRCKKNIIKLLMINFLKKQDISLFYDLKRVIVILKNYFHFTDADVICSENDWSFELVSLINNMLEAHFNVNIRKYGLSKIEKEGDYYYLTPMKADNLDLHCFNRLFLEFRLSDKQQGVKGLLRLIGLAAQSYILDIEY